MRGDPTAVIVRTAARDTEYWRQIRTDRRRAEAGAVARTKKPKVEDPNRLKRERPGRYVTTDGRFAVEGESTGSWYVVDNDRQNELGLPLMAGPFATLDEARARLVATREGRSGEPDRPAAERPAAPDREATQATEPAAPTVPSAAPTAPVTGTKSAAARRMPGAPVEPDTGSAAEAPPRHAWLVRLPSGRQEEARRLLAILDRMGIDDPLLARREIEADLPEIARALLARRVRHDALDIWREPDAITTAVESAAADVRRHLRPLVEPALDAAERIVAGTAGSEDAAAFAWLVALRTIGAVFDAIDSEGDERRIAGEPGWRLVELDGRRE